MSAIGMMDGAFFVGRKEIMDWINITLDLNLAKIEDTANGAIACQLLDIMYPNQVPMHKLNWQAKQDFEFVANYKILQTCFNKLGVEKHVDVDRLISGRYMDNLEFMQWFKKFYELSISDRGDYDPYAQRCKGKGGAQYNTGGKRFNISKPAAVPATLTTKPASKPTTTKSSLGKATASVSQPSAAAPVTEAKPSNQENSMPNMRSSNLPVPPVPHSSTEKDVEKDKEIASLKASLEESRRAYTDVRADMEGVEKERDFYFDKLREIEIMLQEVEEKGEGNELIANIFKVLYATAEGFEPVADEAVPVLPPQSNVVDDSKEPSPETF